MTQYSVAFATARPSSPTGNPYVKTIAYNYDDDGNRSSVVTTLWQQSPATVSYRTNTLNQYTSVGGTNRSHDTNGNVTNDGVRKYAYNYKNLIVKVRWSNDSSLIATYRYDAEGRRVEKAVVHGPFERYLRSRAREPEGSHRKGDNPGKGARYDMSQVVSVYASSDTWKQNFVWGEQIDQIEVLEQADLLDYDNDQNSAEITRSFYHRNALGSVLEITGANQAIVVSYRYDPCGAPTITRGGQVQTGDPLNQHWAYTGRFHDEESELFYYRARYYDPWRGRFVSRDPAGYSEGPSLYCYVNSCPGSRRDPTGLGLVAALLTNPATAAAGATLALIAYSQNDVRGPRARRRAGHALGDSLEEWYAKQLKRMAKANEARRAEEARAEEESRRREEEARRTDEQESGPTPEKPPESLLEDGAEYLGEAGNGYFLVQDPETGEREWRAEDPDSGAIVSQPQRDNNTPPPPLSRVR